MLLRRLAVALAASALSVTALSAAPALALSTQTWVSGVGDDVNPCTRTAPCKTFAGAISKTEEGGEIVALDSGGFGTVTITKAITIDARAVNGSILASLTNGIVVNAGADDRVVLRGLDLTGGYTAQADPSACSPNMLNAVRVLNGGSVVLQDSRITNSSNSALVVTPSTSDPKVIVQNTVMRNGCGPAIKVAPTAGHTATVAVENSTISTNASGIRAEAGGTVNLTGTTLFGNGTNLDAAGGIINAADPSNHVIAQGPLVNANASSVPAMATRTWVSGVGDDANPCSRTAQCKTLAGAFAKTATGGQINLTDNASVGAVTINRPMTIDATGAHTAS
ncbi:MAG: right-handed parallel beta-helix repeat-containing protein [Candidatus Nanopelagicales bacterium]